MSKGNEAKVLEQSWRSRPPLVEYCNAIFTYAFADTIDAECVALKPARVEVTKQAAVALWPLTGNMATKMGSIAKGIHDLVRNPYSIVDKKSNKTTPVRFGDIGVLCRSQDRLSLLAKARHESGIIVGYKRAGFLTTPEGALAMPCLRRLADKNDTLAAAEIRSLVTGEAAKTWLPSRLAHVAFELNNEWGEYGDAQIPALSSLAEARQHLNMLTPVEAMQEALSKGDVRNVINRWWPNEQRARARHANIDCLLVLAGDYEQQCEVRNLPATVADLVMWLTQLKTDEEDWQAIGHDDNTVTLVTHHGAKGLEWPVVIAVDLEKEVRTGLWNLSVIPRIDNFDVNEPLAGCSLQFWPYPFGQQGSGIDAKERIEKSDTGLT